MARDSVLRMDTVCPGLQSAPGPVPPAKFHSRIQQPLFRQPYSGVITLSLSFSTSLAPHFLFPVLDFFDMGIHCYEISVSPDSGMAMGMMEKLKACFKAVGR